MPALSLNLLRLDSELPSLAKDPRRIWCYVRLTGQNLIWESRKFSVWPYLFECTSRRSLVFSSLASCTMPRRWCVSSLLQLMLGKDQEQITYTFCFLVLSSCVGFPGAGEIHLGGGVSETSGAVQSQSLLRTGAGTKGFEFGYEP